MYTLAYRKCLVILFISFTFLIFLNKISTYNHYLSVFFMLMMQDLHNPLFDHLASYIPQ